MSCKIFFKGVAQSMSYQPVILMMGKIYCECGCGELIDPCDKRGRLKRFKNGHNIMKKAEIYQTGRGYVQVKKPDHPRANKWGYVFQHILVAEEKIGRPLLEDEVVHHINKIKYDNRPENLEVMTKKDHFLLHRYDNGYIRTACEIESDKILFRDNKRDERKEKYPIITSGRAQTIRKKEYALYDPDNDGYYQSAC